MSITKQRSLKEYPSKAHLPAKVKRKPKVKNRLLKRAIDNMVLGRPRFYKTPEEFAFQISKYFQVCAKETKPLTITGLCIWLGFESRQSFYDYETKLTGERAYAFSYIAKISRQLIEQSYEERLDNAYCTGAIFALKNMGWTDQRVNVNVPIDKLQVFKIGGQQLSFGPQGMTVVDMQQDKAGTYTAPPDIPAPTVDHSDDFLPKGYFIPI